MRAWTIAVWTETPHGPYLTSIFTLAPTRGEAAAQGVRHAMDTAACGPNCNVRLRAAQVTEVSPDVIRAASDELQRAAA